MIQRTMLPDIALSLSLCISSLCIWTRSDLRPELRLWTHLHSYPLAWCSTLSGCFPLDLHQLMLAEVNDYGSMCPPLAQPVFLIGFPGAEKRFAKTPSWFMRQLGMLLGDGCMNGMQRMAQAVCNRVTQKRNILIYSWVLSRVLSSFLSLTIHGQIMVLLVNLQNYNICASRVDYLYNKELCIFSSSKKK